MLKEVFEKDFYREYPKRKDVLPNVLEDVRSGTFVLCDEKSCFGWQGHNACQNNRTCNHVNLNIYSKEDVCIVSMDNVLSYLQNPLSNNADYILCSADKFRVIEVTCMEEQYVNEGGRTYPKGKRAHAQSQCEKLLLMLYQCGPIREFIDKRQVKESIFSWRKTDNGIVEDNDMASYTLMQNTVDSAIISLPMSFEFRFKEIKYPNVLKW